MATDKSQTNLGLVVIRVVVDHLPEAAVVFGAICCFFALFNYNAGVVSPRSGSPYTLALATGAAFVAIGLALLAFQHGADPAEGAQALGRLTDVEGRWQGGFAQDNLEGDIQVTLTISKGAVSGKATLQFSIGEDQRRLELLLVQREVLHGRFLQLDYRERTELRTVQFGALVVELSEDSQGICGRYVGYGRFNSEIVGGVIDLKKLSPTKRKSPLSS